MTQLHAECITLILLIVAIALSSGDCPIPLTYHTPWRLPRKADGSPVHVLLYTPPYLQRYIEQQEQRMKQLLAKDPANVPWSNLRGQQDQRTQEIYAHFRLKTYSYLTQNISEADVVVVPWLRLTGMLMSWLQFEHGTAPDRTNVKEFSRRIVGDAVLMKYKHKMVFFCDGFRCKHQYRSLKGVLSRAVVARTGVEGSGGQISIPYGLNDKLFAAPDCVCYDVHDREISVFFSGAKRHGDGLWLRPALAELPWESINAYYHVSFHTTVREKSNKLDTLVVNYTSSISNSRFCLILAGDTATSRRLFEALVVGCVPIILSNEWLKYLPFDAYFDWTEVAIIMDFKLPPQTIFDHIVHLLKTNADIPLRQRAKQIFLQQVWGWGVPWETDDATAGGYGQATDLLIQEAYDIINGQRDSMEFNFTHPPRVS